MSINSAIMIQTRQCKTAQWSHGSYRLAQWSAVIYPTTIPRNLHLMEIWFGDETNSNVCSRHNTAAASYINIPEQLLYQTNHKSKSNITSNEIGSNICHTEKSMCTEAEKVKRHGWYHMYTKFVHNANMLTTFALRHRSVNCNVSPLMLHICISMSFAKTLSA